MSTDLNTRDVVLLHGLGRTEASMLPLSWRLGRAGFVCHRIGYPSTRMRVGEAIAFARTRIGRLGHAVHVVGHSMGGLISAALLREDALPIARVVQIGAPNLGSPAADRLGGAWAVRRMCGPAVGELAMHDHVSAAHDRIAAIAGTGGPALPGIDLARPHDGIVSQTSAWAGAAHTANVPGLHSFLPVSAEVARLVITFLTHGRFEEISA